MNETTLTETPDEVDSQEESTPKVEEEKKPELDADSTITITDEFELEGQRIDKVLGEMSPNVSRSAIQQWIKSGNVLVNGKKVKQTYKLLLNDVVFVDVPEEEIVAIVECQPEEMDIDVVYIDDDILVVNKPAGLVVHPGAGNMSGTLMNGVLHHWPESNVLPRAGIVHRLDKDTSGLMVLARNENARLHLIEQLSGRTLSREYLALCLGSMISGGTVKRPMRRDKFDRRKMSVTKSHEGGGKEAITHYRVQERFRKHTLTRVKLETGRTHQIRVHMTHIDFPLVGDPVYGKRLVLPKGCEPSLSEMLRGFKRQALHATRLGLIHPVSEELMSWEVPMPDDMEILVGELRIDTIENQ